MADVGDRGGGGTNKLGTMRASGTTVACGLARPSHKLPPLSASRADGLSLSAPTTSFSTLAKIAAIALISDEMALQMGQACSLGPKMRLSSDVE